MTTIVPVLGASGWAKAISEKADVLLAHFFESDFYQTALYNDAVSSLQYIVEEHGNDELAIVDSLRRQLSTYFSRYFETASVDVTSSVVDSTINITVYAKISENGKEYSVGKLIVVANNKISRVVSLNNQG